MENCSLPDLKPNPGFPEDKIKENVAIKHLKISQSRD